MHNSIKYWNAKIIVKPRFLSNVEDSSSDNYFKVTDEVKSLISNLKEGDDYYSSNGGSQRISLLNSNGTNISKMLDLVSKYEITDSNKGYFVLKNNGGNECVDFVKNLTNNFKGAASWEQGINVINNNISIGTVIATFPNSKIYDYNNITKGAHSAIYMGKGIENGIMYIWMLDQNWDIDGATYHRVPVNKNATHQYNAENYYTVTVK